MTNTWLAAGTPSTVEPETADVAVGGSAAVVVRGELSAPATPVSPATVPSAVRAMTATAARVRCGRRRSGDTAWRERDNTVGLLEALLWLGEHGTNG